jgi:hypothetical protein
MRKATTGWRFAPRHAAFAHPKGVYLRPEWAVLRGCVQFPRENAAAIRPHGGGAQFLRGIKQTRSE